jgi:outer membrane protein assembly factor BamB
MRLVFSLALLILVANGVMAEDWPQWNGATRTGLYSEKQTVRTIPRDGLKKLWSQPVNLGYSGPSVSAGRLFLTDYIKKSGESTNNPGGRDKITGMERVLCFDAASGKELWKHAYDRDYYISYASGPRATPTVDGDRVYALGAEGDLICLSVADGKVIWQRQLRDEHKTESPIWGYSAAPLVVGDLLYTLAGGEGSLLVALDKLTGKERWRALSATSIGYCPPTLIQAGGREQLLLWDPSNVNSLDPKTGAVLWSVPLAPKYEMSIAPPIIGGNKMFVSGIGEVASMYELDSTKPAVKELWRGKVKDAIYCANSTPVFDGDYVYGADCGKGCLICMRASDGERMWETFAPTGGGERRISHGTAFLSKAGDVYYLFSETGDFIIAKLSPEKYDEIGRFHVLEPTNDCFGRSVVWSYPAYANRCLFARNDKELVCYSIAE